MVQCRGPGRLGARAGESRRAIVEDGGVVSPFRERSISTALTDGDRKWWPGRIGGRSPDVCVFFCVVFSGVAADPA